MAKSIKISPNKQSIIEFDVAITGLDKVVPTVRFVLRDINGMDCMVKCSKVKDSTWTATIPALNTKLTSGKFWIEVIIDEYYFKPIEGNIEFVNAPEVSLKDDKKKPSVVATIKEASGGPEVTGQYAPTNSLLSPEENPEDTQGHVKVAQAELDDQFIDDARLDDITDEEPIPGEGEQYPQDDGKEDEFDSRKIAENIVKTIGLGNFHQEQSEKKGSLFKRDANGKIIVPGLENPDQKRKMMEREKKIRDILHH